MDCLVLPVSIFRRRYSGRLGYRNLSSGGIFEDPVTVVVGKEKRKFLVDPFVLEENPFRVLMDTANKENKNVSVIDEYATRRGDNERVIFVDVDSILFEHMLWLVYNDFSSLFKLNIREIIDFYAQDY
ncbi:hypothetical protein LguiA_015315 [Lonicera macranthoides]